MTKAASSYLKTLIKIVVVLGLFYFLGRKGFISLQATRRAFSHWELLLGAFTVMILSNFLGVIRWQWLLEAQDIHLSWTRTTQLTFIGLFFNMALPGAVSGDFVKAFYVGREVEGKRARAFGSILFDRVAGLSALVVVSAVAIAFGYDRFRGTPLIAGIRVFMSVAAIGVVVFYTYLFLVHEDYDPLLKLFNALEKRWAKLGSLTRIYESLRHYHNHRVTVLKALALSAIVHLGVGWVCLQFAHAVGSESLTLLPIYVVVPLGLLFNAIPLAPGGVGTGHAVFLYLFGLIGSDRGADIFSFFVLGSLIVAAIGGVVYLQFRGTVPKPDFASAEVPAPVA